LKVRDKNISLLRGKSSYLLKMIETLLELFKKRLLENSFSLDLTFDDELGLYLVTQNIYELILLSINGLKILKTIRNTKIQTQTIF